MIKMPIAALAALLVLAPIVARAEVNLPPNFAGLCERGLAPFENELGGVRSQRYREATERCLLQVMSNWNDAIGSRRMERRPWGCRHSWGSC